MRIIGEKPFELVDCKTGEQIVLANGKIARFAYHKTAISHLNALKNIGIIAKVSVKVNAAVKDGWRNREMKKRSVRPSFAETDLYKNSEIASLHYIRHSINFPGKVAYTASEEDGVLDKQTVVSFRKYLARFFPAVSMNQAEEYAAQFEYESKNGCELKFATTIEEIGYVYTNGPSSCMSYSSKSFNSTVHPSCFYAAGDLAIAYLVNARGKISSRVLTWPEKKIYTTIYGNAALMRKKLGEIGFRSAETRHQFSGCRVLLMNPDNCKIDKNQSYSGERTRFVKVSIRSKNESEIISAYLANKVDSGKACTFKFFMPYLDYPFSFLDIGAIFRREEIGELEYVKDKNCFIGKLKQE